MFKLLILSFLLVTPFATHAHIQIEAGVGSKPVATCEDGQKGKFLFYQVKKGRYGSARNAMAAFWSSSRYNGIMIYVPHSPVNKNVANYTMIKNLHIEANPRKMLFRIRSPWPFLIDSASGHSSPIHIEIKANGKDKPAVPREQRVRIFKDASVTATCSPITLMDDVVPFMR